MTREKTMKNKNIEELADEVWASAIAMKFLCQMSPDLKCMTKIVDEHCQKVKRLQISIEVKQGKEL